MFWMQQRKQPCRHTPATPALVSTEAEMKGQGEVIKECNWSTARGRMNLRFVFCFCWVDLWYHFVRVEQYQQILWTRLFGIETRYLMIARLHDRDYICICTVSNACRQGEKLCKKKWWSSAILMHDDILGLRARVLKNTSWQYEKPISDRAGWTNPPDWPCKIQECQNSKHWWIDGIGQLVHIIVYQRSSDFRLMTLL